MNWTGGHLQRHSTTTSTAAQRQRQHFARVQQNLGSGGIASKQSSIEVFGVAIEGYGRGHSRAHSTVQASRERSQSIHRTHASPSLTSHLSRRHGVKHSFQPHVSETSRPLLRTQINREQTHVPDDDLYNATPPPPTMKRKLEVLVPVSGSDIGSASQQQDEESLSEKKRRILRKGDWLGITIQKPLQLAFASTRDEQNIGKRRKVMDSHKAKYHPMRSRVVSPFAAKRQPFKIHPTRSQEPQRTGPSAPDVRISIGDRTVPPGVSSSTAPRKRISPSTGGRRSSRAASSIMLLDDESLQGYQPEIESDNRISRTTESLHPGWDIVEQASESKRFPSREQSQNQNDLLDLSGVAEEGWARVTAESLEILQIKFQAHQGPHGERSATHSHTTPATDPRRCLCPGQVVFSSSSASIHHPRPRSSKTSVLLRSNSSQLTASNIAQVGMAKAVISSSQVLENEIWRTWVAPADSDETQQDSNEFYELPSGNGWNSPGISIASARRLDRHVPVEDDYSSELGVPDTDDIHDNEQRSVSGKSHYEDASSQRMEDDSETPEIDHIKVGALGLRSAEGRQGKSPAIFRQSKVQPPIPIVEQRIEDPNDAWRKFVFGSSSDAAETPSPGMATAAKSSNISLKFSSIIAYPATQYSSDLPPFVGFPNATTPGQPATSTASRFTDNSPLHIKSRRWNSNLANGALCRFPSGDGSNSMDASKESNPTSGSELAPTTMTVQADSPSTSHTGHISLHQLNKKILLGKPKPFIGRKSRTDDDHEKEPMYIGRGSRDKADGVSAGSKRKRERDVYSILGSNEQDELKFVEDD